MTLEALLFQALNGLAAASSLFFVGAGLSLIFGVTRIINIAHGSFYMLGLYLAATFATKVGGALGFWGGIAAAGVLVAALGALIEMLLLRRIYQAPELFQLLATFALVLIINDATQYVWGPEDLLGPRAPGLRGSVEILGRNFPSYDLFLIVIGPLGHAGPRDGRRARRQPGHAVHRGIRARRLPRRLRRRAAGGARARQSRARPGRHQRRLRRRGGRRHGLGHRRLPGGRHHRRSQGAVHRDRPRSFRRVCPQFLQAHAGGGIPGDGDRSDRAALWAARPPARRGAQSGRDRGSDPARDLAVQARRRRRARWPSPACVRIQGLALCAGARHRRADRGPVRDLAAFHHGPRRHAFLRPRRLFRPRRLWRGADGEVLGGADGGRAHRCAARGAA